MGVLLRGVRSDGVGRGDVLTAPGTVKTYTRFTADIRLLTKQEGGRATPINTGDRAFFMVRTADVAGTVSLAQGAASIAPGESATVEVTLTGPVPMAPGLEIKLVEAGLRVGTGTVIEVIK
ncbi:EF-Tu C-terminal domain-related protein [Nocardia tengchongensis]|uniref:EF-Tu C-terminal domain-related protein n=1 Tax=Nocardia tengchongensis TaxID=2055889 RepID=UPI0036A01448